MFDLEGNAELDSLDNVPEDYRHFYEEADGRFTLSQDPRVQGAIKLVSGQHKALTAARSEAAQYRKSAVDMSPLSEWGSTPSEVAAAINARIEEIQKDASKGKVDVDKMKQSMEQAAQKKLEPYQQKIGALEGQLKELLVGNTASKAIAEAKGNAKLLMPHIERQVECVSERSADGREEYRVYVLDEQGQRRFSGTRAGEYMNITELVEELKKDKDFGRMFDSEAPRGGGSPPTGAGRGPVRTERLSSVDKIGIGIEKRQYKNG